MQNAVLNNATWRRSDVMPAGSELLTLSLFLVNG